MFNPAALLSFRQKWGEFEQRHPKFVMFIGALMKSGVPEGSIIDIKITMADGQVLESNLKVSPEDVEFLKAIGQMQK